jgi:hypothetical protein
MRCESISPCSQSLREINTCLAKIELRLENLHHAQSLRTFLLNDSEKKIVAALRLAGKPLKAAALAQRMKCGDNSNFRTILRFLTRLGVLGKSLGNGYFVVDSRDSITVRVALADEHQCAMNNTSGSQSGKVRLDHTQQLTHD